MEQDNLFDVDETSAPSESASSPQTLSTWNEVPPALFLSWSTARQLNYCARRDRHSASEALDPEWRQFYEDRAEGYEADAAL